jgi:hypothetical protein
MVTAYGARAAMRSAQTSFAHGDPDVGGDEVGAPDTLVQGLGEGDASAAGRGEGAGPVDDLLGRPVVLRGDDTYVHAEQGAGDQVGVAHVEAGVAQVGEDGLRQRLGAVLGHGQHVGEHLGGVPVVGEPVVDGHTGVRRQLLHLPLAVAPVLDPVVHPAQYPRGVPHRLLVADL